MKDELRKIVKEKRNRLQKIDVLTKSSQIKKRLFEMDKFRKANSILFYVSYGNEVFTHDMIKECLSENKNVVVPVTDIENRCLILSKLESWSDLTRGAYNILEPKKEKIDEVSIFDIDLIIVPGVGFDEKGRRIGHGKGYYDNLLRKSTKALHIGLAFELQIVGHVPTEKHDVTLDRIITEKRIINCIKN